MARCSARRSASPEGVKAEHDELLTRPGKERRTPVVGIIRRKHEQPVEVVDGVVAMLRYQPGPNRIEAALAATAPARHVKGTQGDAEAAVRHLIDLLDLTRG